MVMYNIEQTFKEEIDTLWNNPKYAPVPDIQRGYAVQRDIPFGSILFIGINPSYSEKKTKEKNSFFYSNHQQEEVHPYFRKFQDISEKVKVDWSHLDLLYIRQTDQKKVQALFKNDIATEFLNKQLAISKEIIENCKPQVIIVSNAYARELFKDKCHFETPFDENIGTHKIVNNNLLEGTAVFYTSMLTGQRALDNGSYKRLVWHIKKILKSDLKMKNKISKEVIEGCYKIAKLGFENSKTIDEVRLKIHNELEVNFGSSRAYPKLFEIFMTGEGILWGLSADTYDIFLENIFKDYGKEQQKKSTATYLRLIEYLEKDKKGSKVKLRKVYDKYVKQL